MRRLTLTFRNGSLLLSIAGLVFMSACAGSKSEEERTSAVDQETMEAPEIGPENRMTMAPEMNQPDREADPFQFDSPGDTSWTMSGLGYVIYEEGGGKQVEKGMKVRVDYAGYLNDGTIFDTSLETIGQRNNFDRGGYPFEPIEFVVGEGNVISGWDEGLMMMRVGGKRRLIIPPGLGYGSKGAPPSIPGGATLLFDVYVLDATTQSGSSE